MTGARGLLGSEIVRASEAMGVPCVGLGREDADVTDADAVHRALGEACRRVVAASGGPGPLWVVHCAAYTAVDRAEAEPELAHRVNGDGAANVARAAARADARVAYISTDYVYDTAEAAEGGKDATARRPWRPSDPVAPRSVYARTKLAGEEAVRERSADALIVRTGWLYGGGGRNFVRSILDRAERGQPVRVVDDQWGRPTWTRTAAGAILELMQHGVSGTWHVADGGEATWLDFAREALRIRELPLPVIGVSTETWGAAAPRPHYSVLDLAATEATLGRAMPDWKESLRRFLEDDGSNEERG